jgi:hypothetical protein
VRIESSPVYLDTSALAKLYLPESDSDALEAALIGRTDLVISDLAVTELCSALGRRSGAGELDPSQARAIHARVLRDVREERYGRAELVPEVHREAERLLLGSRTVHLRAADALHLALARASGAAALVTFDRRMRAAVDALGLFELPD